MSTDVQAGAAQAEVSTKIRWGKPHAGSTPAARTTSTIYVCLEVLHVWSMFHIQPNERERGG